MTGFLFETRARMRRVPGFGMVFDAVQGQNYRRWVRAGSPEGPPPQRYKADTLRSYAVRFGLRVLVETGTAWGDSVCALQGDFDQVYTIELGERLHAHAVRRFRRYPHVHVLRGDSGQMLGEVLRGIDQPCLFWLDGHYGGAYTARGIDDSPIARELTHVFAHPCAREHVVLIDDARFFTGVACYPTTDELRARFVAAGLDCFDVEHDVIRAFRSRGR
jgi:hypothetical protein